jgi:hypothetical protein
MRVLYASAVLVIAVGVAGTWWAVTELREGVSEVPNHWWSTFPVALVVLGSIFGLTARAALRRR